MKTLFRSFSVLLMLLAVSFSGCLIEEEDNGSDPRDKFLGLWKVTENCNRGDYSSTITYDPSNSSQVLIGNFANPGSSYNTPAVGLVTGNTVYIANQTIGPSWTVSGQGVYYSNSETIEWDYSLKIGGNLFQCSATYSK